ncbi:tryptophan synthase subunit alpha [Kutzneria sp. CA-103260]|uniref:tryptophan synthase subunit alpha n=1 Tax=Kutzneria sp. CA-103260 TaxID=2802641 RepID=UPI001BACF6C2|nr:tryptophan synthase subunit alpha [Kutzneria sp. CA-103260]QUQ62967.1 tryptophan synthase subunit alpha [Kutzneria sp. CA-103260]
MKTLVGYLTAGFPTVDDSARALIAMAESGCDVLEIGLPYTDPVMDGPAIQAASTAALRNGTRTEDVLRVVERVAARTGVPVLVMTYWNPVEQYGIERFADRLHDAGGAGCVLPDLPVQHSQPWRQAAGSRGLDSVFIAAPSSTDRRVREIAEASTGFVYAASTLGVTGMRSGVGGSDLVARIRAVTELPVYVGLGVSSGKQAKEVASFADGVIVGSAIVRRMLDAPDADTGIESVRELCRELATGTHQLLSRT